MDTFVSFNFPMESHLRPIKLSIVNYRSNSIKRISFVITKVLVQYEEFDML